MYKHSTNIKTKTPERICRKRETKTTCQPEKKKGLKIFEKYILPLVEKKTLHPMSIKGGYKVNRILKQIPYTVYKFKIKLHHVN